MHWEVQFLCKSEMQKQLNKENFLKKYSLKAIKTRGTVCFVHYFLFITSWTLEISRENNPIISPWYSFDFYMIKDTLSISVEIPLKRCFLKSACFGREECTLHWWNLRCLIINRLDLMDYWKHLYNIKHGIFNL